MTQLEHLPNEIILDIFTYFDPRGLFISLFNLNARLNTLIHVQPVIIKLGNGIPKYALDLYYKSILFHARGQVHTLELSDTYGRMTHFITNNNQIETDFETRKFILFHVKSLNLWNPLITSLGPILTYINDIEHIRITLTSRPRHIPNDTHAVMKSLFEMKSLKRMEFKIYDTIVFDDDIGISQSLTYVTLYGCGIQDLTRLLRRMPNIRTLAITCSNRPDLHFVDQDSTDYSSYDKLAHCIPYLTNLKLDIYHTPFKEIEMFLRQLPQLIKFSFSSLTIENYSDGSNWEHVINSYLPNLQLLSLFITKRNISENIVIDLNQMIQSFDTFFWDRWPVVIECYTVAMGKKHLVLYTLPIQQTSLRIYLYGVETRQNRSSSNKDIGKKLNTLHFILHENPMSNTLLPNRIYSNLDSFSFSSELIDPRSYQTDTILTDLQQICSTSVFSKIKGINLYGQIYPTNFLSKLLELLPNITRLRVPALLFDISIDLPLIKSLLIDFNSSITCYSTNILRQIGIHFPNIYFLSFELRNAQDIYILLSYCLRKLSHLLYVDIKLNEIDAHIDSQEFILWFNDYKQLNGLHRDVQVELNDDETLLRISY